MQLAGCIIKDKDDKILLVHRRTDKHSRWEIPGGKVNHGEIPTQTAVRELHEELGVTVNILRQVGARSFNEDGIDYEYFWFEATIIEGNPYIAEPDTFDNLKYLSLDELEAARQELSPNTTNFLDAVQRKEVEF